MNCFNNAKLKSLMKERKVTNVALASEIGCTATFVSYMLNGRKKPSFDTTCIIADYLNVKVDELRNKPA